MNEDAAYRATALGHAYAQIDRLPVAVLLDNVRSLYNVGAFFRTADAVRAEAIVLAGITPTPEDPRIAKTALGAERSLSWSKAADTAAAIDGLRARGHEIAAIETSLQAVDLFDWHPRFPVCVVFGHEVDGIAQTLLERCDIHVRIDAGHERVHQRGDGRGVVLYELLRKCGTRRA
jgi:tRNA G18 (ribose-2'-O)-methylase SpoU